MSSIYEMARQRIAGTTIKTPTKKVTISEFGRLVKATEPKKEKVKAELTPEEIAEKKERQKKYSHDWYLKHKAECTAKSREWAMNNREKARNFSRNYYWSHREERNAASKKWRDGHKEIYNARMMAYRKKQKAKRQAQNDQN